MKIEVIQTETFQMRHIRFGNSKAPMIAVLPGLSIKSVMESADQIAEHFQQLVQDFEIVVFDRRDDLPDRYTVADMAEDTAQALRMIGDRPIHLFGASQGGMIAMLIASRYPRQVRSALVVSTTAVIGEEETERFQNWIALAKEHRAKDLVNAFAKEVYSDDFYAAYRQAFDAMGESVTEEELKRFVILSEGMLPHDVSGELSKIKCPLLAVASKGDKIFPADAAERIAKATGGESYIYQEYAHAVYDEAPDFVDRMRTFFLAH